MKHKTVNKTTCRTSSANPGQQCPHYLKIFSTAMIIIWGFQDLQIYLEKWFWSILNSPSLTFQQLFCKSKVNKTIELVYLWWREITTVTTVTVFKLKFIFSHKSSKKQEKEAGINFILLSRSRQMIGWFMKTYLHRPINILQFLSRGKIQKFNITSKYFSIFNNKLPASWVTHITRDFLTCCSSLYYSSML